MSLIKKITKTIDASINDFCATLAEKFDLNVDELLEIWKQNGGSSTTKSKTVKKRSAYVNYSMYLRPILLEENPDMTFGEISGETSKRWKLMSAEEKLEYHSSDGGESAETQAPKETKPKKKSSPKKKKSVQKEVDPNDLSSKKVTELKEMCKAQGLAQKGTKAELIERLNGANNDVASLSSNDEEGSTASQHSPVLELGEMDEEGEAEVEAEAENSECGISPVSIKSLVMDKEDAEDSEDEQDETQQPAEEKVNYSDMSLAQIKTICKEKGLSTKGNKNELIHRLMA